MHPTPLLYLIIVLNSFSKTKQVESDYINAIIWRYHDATK